MTNQERIAVVQKLGYTERQAAFLCLAALHGGYFLRRQCNAFFGLEPGGTADRLINRAIEKGHVRSHASANQTLIYHVGNKAFFEAIGEEDNRNRRLRQPYSIKIKLMGFDYVLAHPEHLYLATESEKLDYFYGVLCLSLRSFPARIYYSKRGRLATTRYFVDKFPLFLSGAPSAPSPVVGFSYIDGSTGKPSGFDTYLSQYRELWERLGRFQVVYVSADRQMFPKAERIFRRLCGGVPAGVSSISDDPEKLRMLEHFRMRERFECRDTASFDREHLDRLRDELKEFRGPEYDALYQRWKEEGDAMVVGERSNAESSRCSFSTLELTHDYKFFGDLFRMAPKNGNGKESGFMSTER